MVTDLPRFRTLIFAMALASVLFMAMIAGCTKMIHTRGGEGGEDASPFVTTREFPDVPIPKELKLDHKNSFVYMAPGLATGLMVYDGNVDYESLISFFQESLPARGWELKASLKYPSTMLFYEKEARICLVTMKTMPLNVHVEIWVAPLETLYYEGKSEDYYR